MNEQIDNLFEDKDFIDKTVASIIELTTRVAHEVNRVYCQSHGDHSHLPYYETPEIITTSTKKGVVNQLLNGPGLSPRESHEAWCQYKLNEGWVYGEVKDVEKKTHPNLVDYDDLPESEKFKDVLFTTICETIFSHTNLREIVQHRVQQIDVEKSPATPSP